ncbi:MAG: potassium channel family protein [Verrucomicrobia bacterium]|nr:potassium channel family protein [Verrucomicrobiota bacterium]
MNNSRLSEAGQLGIVQVALLILTVVLLAVLVADTIWTLPDDVSRIIQGVDTIVCGLLLLDFFVRLHRAENKRAFLKWGWIDLVASIPNIDVLRWGRVVRVLRVIRLLRGIRSVHKALAMIFEKKMETGAVSLVLSAFLLIAFSSASILICERAPDANIKTAEDAVWWSVTTITTVGYGDKYPVTTEGRILGMTLMLAGIGMFGALGGLVASFFLGKQGNELSETKEILDRLDRLQAKLDTLGQERSGSGGGDKSG